MNHRRLYTNPTDQNGATDDPSPGSPLSGDEAKSATAPSPKKSKRSVKKRVVSVPIADVDGPKSKGEAYPPSDSWAWRKYGQKPIKGSPYPRGYYRCSSSKGCPARKQVERSRVDPTMLVITYACEHNHAAPATKHHPASAAATASSPSPTTSSSPPSSFRPDDLAAFSGDRFGQIGDDLPLLASEFGWLSDVSSTSLLHSPICTDENLSMVMVSGIEDEESFFADLGELPECSMVFRRSVVEPDARGERCSLSAITCMGGTG